MYYLKISYALDIIFKNIISYRKRYLIIYISYLMKYDILSYPTLSTKYNL